MAKDIPVDTATLGDTSKYIRTYAKDMAALGGNAAPAASTTQKNADLRVPVSAPAKKRTTTTDSVTLEEPDAPFFERQVPKSEQDNTYAPEALPSKAELDSEVLEKPKKIPATIEPQPIPLMPKTQGEVTPDAAPIEVKEKRESILARLRKRVGKDAQMEIQPLPPPHPPKEAPTPIVEEKPVPATVLKPVEARVPEPKPELLPRSVATASEPIFEPIPEPVPVAAPEPLPMPVPEPEPIPEPAPAPEPIPEPIPEPEPVIPEPVPIISEPVPIVPEPIPVVPEPAPIIPEPAPQPEPVPIAPTETTTYREPIPEPAPRQEIYTPIAPLPKREPVLQSSDEPSPLHTYTTDFAGKIDSSNASTFSVLAAQADAGQLRPITIRPKKRFTWVPVAAGVVLLLVGGTGLVFAYQYMAKLHAVPLAAPTAPSLIFVDGRMELHGTGTELMNALAQAATNPLPDGNVLQTYVTQATTTPKGIAAFIPAPGGSLISALQLPAPDILLRNIDPASTVGVIHAGAETKPFFILRVDSYERTFAGMLTWEPVMWRDLATLYPLYAPVALPVTIDTSVGTGTASTTETSSTTPPSAPVVQPQTIQASPRATFDDEVVASHDVRVLHDTNGATLLLYGYYDKQTLIIARDEAAFGALLNRLSATTVQQ